MAHSLIEQNRSHARCKLQSASFLYSTILAVRAIFAVRILTRFASVEESDSSKTPLQVMLLEGAQKDGKPVLLLVPFYAFQSAAAYHCRLGSATVSHHASVVAVVVDYETDQ